MTTEDFSQRLSSLRDRIALASCRVGRSPTEVTLVAVTKRQPPEAIGIAANAGLLNFGENYVQEAIGKRGRLSAVHGCWHLIGHLQSNKVKAAVGTFDLIQSVDSIGLARKIARQAAAQGTTQRILLQVHLGDEATKTGVPPASVAGAVPELLDLPGLQLQGLMGISPQDGNPRSHFRLLRQLFEGLPAPARSVLSMGMTNDFETAIEEGATMVRIGTALFGARMTEETTATLAR